MIYLDTSFVIAAVEDSGPAGTKALRALAENPDEKFAISALVLMECLVLPLRTDNYRVRLKYERFFETLEILELDEPALTRAAELRAKHTISTTDAMHLACADYNLCTGFWTNDKRLNKIASGLAVKVFPEI